MDCRFIYFSGFFKDFCQIFRSNLEKFWQKLGLFSRNFCSFDSLVTKRKKSFLHIQRANKVSVIMNKTASFHAAFFLVFWAKFHPARLFRTPRLSHFCQYSTLHAYSALHAYSRVSLRTCAMVGGNFLTRRLKYLKWLLTFCLTDHILVNFISKCTSSAALRCFEIEILACQGY